ncbi:MAG: (Fe-S)-binding protein [Syntrophobacteraceae bacterium]
MTFECDAMAQSDVVAERCIECDRCRKDCAFLQERGLPKAIASAMLSGDPACLSFAYECSLCGLCTAVCPVGLDPAGMILEIRREAVRQGKGCHPEHGVLLAYEKRGISPRYTHYALPEGCTTVFFPGCALPGTRPKRVIDIFEKLREVAPTLGIVLDCCTAPSHSLGREDHFRAMFGEMRGFLLDNGIREVLVACPNCYKVFKNFGGGLKTRTIYEALADNGLSRRASNAVKVSIHDSCAVRFDESIHAAVRKLSKGAGLSVEESHHRGRKTVCCGEGGAAGFVAPELAGRWTSLRVRDAGGRKILAYCAGCTAALGRRGEAIHIADILFDPDAALAGKAKISRPPLTYWNRMRLKSYFKKHIPVKISRERRFQAARPSGGAASGWLDRILGFLKGPK